MPYRERLSKILAMRIFKETVDAFSQRQLAVQSGRLRYCFSLFTLVRGAWLRACRMRVDNMKDLRPERKQVRFSIYPLEV